jgi:hypothetical protein
MLIMYCDLCVQFQLDPPKEVIEGKDAVMIRVS